MPKFLYVFRGGARVTPGLSPTELQAHLKKWTDWVTELTKAGKHVPGGYPVDSAGKTLRGRERTMTDGPYAESKDLVIGNLVVEAASLEEAARLAEGCPVLEYDGSVEVRPILERTS